MARGRTKGAWGPPLCFGACSGRYITIAEADCQEFWNSFVSDKDTHDLVRRIESGDNEAASVLFGQYVDRLIGLARKNLSPRLARRVDPEDVVQSAYRSFFRRACAGDYDVDDTEELWRLLAAITINKVRRTAKYNTAGRRDVNAEESVSPLSVLRTVGPVAIDRGPLPEEATILVEETQRMMADLTPLQRNILSLRLQAHTTEEAAQRAGCSERTVYRTMEQIQADLQRRLNDHVRE